MKRIACVLALMCCMAAATAQHRAATTAAPGPVSDQAIPDLPLPVEMIRSKAKTNDAAHDFSDYVRVGTILNTFPKRKVTSGRWDVAGSVYTLHATLANKPFVVTFEYMPDRGATVVHATLAGKPYPAGDLVNLIEIVTI